VANHDFHAGATSLSWRIAGASGKIECMNYYGAKELADSFRTVRKNTVTIAEEIGDQHYGFRPAPDTRTVGSTLVHIALTTRLPYQIHGVERLTSLANFDFPTFFGKMMAEENTPRSKQQIVAMLREDGERFAKWLESLSDDFLGQSVTFPPGMTPPTKSRFEMLLGAKEHEMHHRGQLMVMERLIGIVPHLTREMQARMAAMQSNKVSA
jgi:uncharacterized damage-inducible protein DinB